MKRAEVIALLRHTADQIREDMALMKSGVIKCACLGADATSEQVVRLERLVTNIEAIIDAYQAEDRAGNRTNDKGS